MLIIHPLKCAIAFFRILQLPDYKDIFNLAKGVNEQCKDAFRAPTWPSTIYNCICNQAYPVGRQYHVSQSQPATHGDKGKIRFFTFHFFAFLGPPTLQLKAIPSPGFIQAQNEAIEANPLFNSQTEATVPMLQLLSRNSWTSR